jgi:hypothetical protein
MTGARTRWLCVPTARALVDAVGMSALAALHAPGRRVAERAGRDEHVRGHARCVDKRAGRDNRLHRRWPR